MSSSPPSSSSHSNNITEDINFSVLLRAGKEALEACEEKIQTWKTKQSEYLTLKENLEKLPNELTHDVMVPFGSCALMHGKMIHTNEIMVLLGENWFVERTAFQAIEIIMRRLEYVEKQLKKLEEEKEFFTKRLQMVDEFEKLDEGVVEIREMLTDDDEALLSRRHRTKGSTVIEEEPGNVDELETSPKPPPGVSDEDYAKLMARLDDLEKLEEQQDSELINESVDSLNEDEEHHVVECSSTAVTDKTHFVDIGAGSICENIAHMTSTSSPQVGSDDVSKEVGETVKDLLDGVDKLANNDAFLSDSCPTSPGGHGKRYKRVTWNEHGFEIIPLANAEESPTTEESKHQTLSSPSRTVGEHHHGEYRDFVPVKSILKNRREASPIDHKLIHDMEERRTVSVITGSVEAFTGVVCEKPLATKNAIGEIAKPQSHATHSVHAPEPLKRRASKFKVQRTAVQ